MFASTMRFFYPLLLLPTLCWGQEVTLTYSLKEEQDENTFVGNVARDSYLYGNVTDDIFQRLKFNFFSKGNPFSSLFKIDEKSSTIRTATVIDREAPDVCEGKAVCVLNLDIAVYIKDVSRNRYDLYKLMQAKVNLLDINDNKPEFPAKSVSLSLPESVQVNHMLLASGAIDTDTDNNSIKSYEIIPPNGMFGLQVQNDFGTSDLGIVVKHRLDRETKDFFQVTIIAKDGGYPQMTGTVLINITVTDVNDNRPVFIKSVFNVTVSENPPINSTVLMLSAVDQDKDDNGKISYHFSSRVTDEVRAALAIDASTGKVYTKGKIDFEARNQFQFMVEARDHGSPALASLATVVINVLDENDNAPQININLSPEGTDISEGAETGKFIAHVSVSDADLNQNGLITCDMNDAHFSLDRFYKDNSNIYKITLKEKLDHESSPSHNVTITCKDSGNPQLENSTSFLVTVLDENDNYPGFSQDTFTGSIVENNKIGEEILQITAHDWDSGDNGRVSYALDVDASNMFTINSNTGVVVANMPYDRESQAEFRFGVIAMDHGTPSKSSSAQVIISIRDQNDKPPKFTQPIFTGFILENQPIATKVLTLNATDADSKPQMMFSISSSSPAKSWFSIDPASGVIKSKVTFDREIQKKFNLTVVVRDPQVSSFRDTAQVTVYVLDDNDNIPEIIYPTTYNNTVRVMYGTKTGTVFSKVMAKDTDDIDSMSFRKLTYSIQKGNTRSLFNINSMNGDVAISRLMRPADSISYKLIVAVHDSGAKALSATATLNVIIVDGNGTSSTGAQEGGLDQNMMIVIILIAVTVILAIAIFATICMIRRIDRERQHRRAVMMKADEDKSLAHITNRDTYLVIASKDSNENEDAKLKRNKKEVSFTFEDDRDMHNISNSSGHASMSTFGVPAPPDNPHHARHLMEILKKPDDIMSETSGETGTSDSGRGGSDEDINSNRSANHDIDETQILHPAHLLGAEQFTRYKDGCHSEVSRSSRRGGPCRHIVSPTPDRPIKYGRENSGEYKSHDIPQGYTASPCHFEHYPSHASAKDSLSQSLQNGGYHRMDLPTYPPRQTDFMLTGNWRADSMSYRDDDDRTTTSGSYTINPEELRNDMDDVFYTEQDIVV